MAFPTDWQHILRPETKFVWQGWESTLASLTHTGWVFKMQENRQWHSVQIWGRNNSMGMSLVTQHVYVDRLYRGHQSPSYPVDYLMVKVDFLAPNVTVSQMGELNLESFKDVQMGVFPDQMMNVDTAMIFEGPNDPEELIVDPARIGELMEKIREAQSPKAKEILQKQGLRDRVNSVEVSARLLSVVSA